MTHVILAFLLVGFSSFALAADEEKPGLTNETQLGYVVVGGNAQSETTSVKHLTKYNWEYDTLKFTGHYIQSSGLVDAPTPTNPDAEEERDGGAAPGQTRSTTSHIDCCSKSA